MPTKTKGEVVSRAFSWIRINGTTTNPNSSENADALSVLEGLMHDLESRNIVTGFVFEDDPDYNTESGIPNQFWLSAAYLLASAIAPDYGKAITQAQMQMVAQGVSNWSSRTSKARSIKHPNRHPRGSGNTFRLPAWNRYYADAESPPNSTATENITRGAINDYTYSIIDYLEPLEDVVTESIVTTSGLTLITSSFVDNVWMYRVECALNAQDFQRVQFSVETTLGRKQSFIVNFSANGAVLNA